MTPPTTLSEWVWYWYDQIGANVIPANSKQKQTWIKWGQYQKTSIPREQVQQWLDSKAYESGVAILAGRIWRGLNEGSYLIFLDFDSKEAIEAFCGPDKDISGFGKDNLLEQHLDNPNKAHVYIISPVPIANKGSNKLGLEIKSESRHGLAYCTPSIHKNGYPYQIVGTLEPIPIPREGAISLEHHLTKVFEKAGIPYNLKHNGATRRRREPKYKNILSNKRMNSLIETLAPKYEVGKRNNIIMHLAGFLRKSGVPQSNTEELVRRLCDRTGMTDEMSKTMDTIKRTYEKPINNIRGYTGLKEVLG